MALIKSISGIRGTIGGLAGENLTPIDIVAFAAAFATLLKQKGGHKAIVGRDARISGANIKNLLIETLVAYGIDVIDTDLNTTPGLEMTIIHLKADGGVMITASHNPKQWNALKFFNHKGEFISDEDGSKMLQHIAEQSTEAASVDQLGKVEKFVSSSEIHIESICSLPTVLPDLIGKSGFKVVVDCINSTASISLLPLLEKLGVEVIGLNTEMHGDFAHNPEPLPDHLIDLKESVLKHQADLGIAVDPDADRICFVCEDGTFFGEEYTIVSIADYLLSYNLGPLVSNLSSTQALKDVAEKHGVPYHSSAVGEVNVVQKMKESHAVFGGEGNGGVIYPALHYGRDALLGAALFLSQMAKSKLKPSELKALFPVYFISKQKVSLSPVINPEKILYRLKEKYKNKPCITIDGLKISFDKEWVHLRKSNTEPIIRIYAESTTQKQADDLAFQFRDQILEIAKT